MTRAQIITLAWQTQRSLVLLLVAAVAVATFALAAVGG